MVGSSPGASCRFRPTASRAFGSKIESIGNKDLLASEIFLQFPEEGDLNRGESDFCARFPNLAIGLHFQKCSEEAGRISCPHLFSHYFLDFRCSG